MIKIMADNWGSCGYLWVGHFVDILAGTMLKVNPLFLEITVYLKNEKIYIWLSSYLKTNKSIHQISQQIF